MLLRRIALTRGHLADLPSFPASDKKKDPRYEWFVGNFGDRCWELDALDPNELRDCVQREILGLIEPTAEKLSMPLLLGCESSVSFGSLSSLLTSWVCFRTPCLRNKSKEHTRPV